MILLIGFDIFTKDKLLISELQTQLSFYFLKPGRIYMPAALFSIGTVLFSGAYMTVIVADGYSRWLTSVVFYFQMFFFNW